MLQDIPLAPVQFLFLCQSIVSLKPACPYENDVADIENNGLSFSASFNVSGSNEVFGKRVVWLVRLRPAVDIK